MKCKECGKEYEHNNPSCPGYCSYKCYEKYARFHKEPNCVCPVCGRLFYMKPYRINKTKHLICCSKECDSKYRSQWFRGEANHQYGLVGNLNATFKNEDKMTYWGYVSVSAPFHPYRNCENRVFEHRLVVEEKADMFDDKYFIVIDGKKYLKPEYHVHHINEVRTDN